MSLSTTLRTTGNLGTKVGLVAQASIIGKEFGIAPEITETISDISAQLPQLLNISSDIPGIGDFLMQFEGLRTLSEDVQNFGNIAIYMSVFAIVYWIGRFMGGEKGRFEAFGSSIVWTAIAAGLLNEFYQYTQNNGKDLFTWMPLEFFEQLPEDLKSYLLENTENRKTAWALSNLGLGTIPTYLGIKNFILTILGPKIK